MSETTLVLVSGGFDPLHSGHIAFFKAAKELGTLGVAVNSDDWLIRKKGKYFMNVAERMSIIKELKCVDVAIEFSDKDDTANDAIKMALEVYNKVIFCNGGDRNKSNIPEMAKWKDDDRVSFVFGVGGDDKKNSSSWILNRWNEEVNIH